MPVWTSCENGRDPLDWSVLLILGSPSFPFFHILPSRLHLIL